MPGKKNKITALSGNRTAVSSLDRAVMTTPNDVIDERKPQHVLIDSHSHPQLILLFAKHNGVATCRPQQQQQQQQ